MELLKIIKASAGSGKTYTLTQEYLDLLLNGGKDAYKHILAVTFTNKATDEMKSRVIEALYNLSREESAKGAKAKRILKDILNDYSNFSVSTIDRFFQVAMRAFAKEIGQFASYRVELDSEAVLSQSVDIMMSSLDGDSNKDLLKWLTDYSLSIMESGKSWNVTPELLSLSKLFLKEEFKVKRKKFAAASMNKAQMKKFVDKMRVIVSDFEEKLCGIGCAGLDIMKDHKLKYSDYKYGKRSPFSHFDKWSRGVVKEPTDSFHELHGDIEKWYTKQTKGDIQIAIEGTYYGGLDDLVGDAIDLFTYSFTTYRSAKVVLDNVYIVGIFADIYATMNQFLKDNNIVLLGETTDALSRIIDGSDTPFIYEKLGVRYDHIMLDEFQDTSLLQWNNFKPLYNNGLASGNRELVVGDVKQSIYRWRGSDWNLLDSKIYDDFDDSVIQKKVLQYNWRSCENIVRFNNNFFEALGGIISKVDATIGDRVTSIYKDCIQLTPEQLYGKLGHVKVQFLKAKDDNGEKLDVEVKTMSLLLKDIKHLRRVGYKLKDIAILTRTNKEGAKVATYLLERGYAIITDDSLAISSSPIVRVVVSVLKYLINPNDPVNCLMLEESSLGVAGLSHSIGDLQSDSLYSLCEEIIHKYVGEVPSSEIPFVQGFLDMVIDYVSKYGSNIRGFMRYWDEKGCKLSIAAPEGQDAIRVMTIHKSKGLGFEAVIVPFLKENFTPPGTLAPDIWCEPQQAPFSEIGLIPLKASKTALSNTIFEDDLNNELLCYCVDGINTAYVAFTRAKKELIIYATEPVAKSDGSLPIASVADALYNYLKSTYWMKEKVQLGRWWRVNQGALPDLEKADTSDVAFTALQVSIDEQMDEEENLENEAAETAESFEMEPTADESIVSEVETDLEGTIETIQTKFVTIPIDSSKLSLSLRSRDFFEEDYAETASEGDDSTSEIGGAIRGVSSKGKRVRGIVMHDILSRIDTVADLEKAVEDAIYSGDLAAIAKDEVLSYLKNKLAQVADKHWFDGTYRSLNELSIIDSDGIVSRPDRVLETREELLSDRTAIVIDYKFGKRRPSYQKQIDGYVTLLQQMGYLSVVGEVWYVDE